MSPGFHFSYRIYTFLVVDLLSLLLLVVVVAARVAYGMFTCICRYTFGIFGDRLSDALLVLLWIAVEGNTRHCLLIQSFTLID